MGKLEKIIEYEIELETLSKVLFETKARMRSLNKLIKAEKFPSTAPCGLDFYGIRSGECSHAHVVGTHDTINCVNPKCKHYIK